MQCTPQDLVKLGVLSPYITWTRARVADASKALCSNSTSLSIDASKTCFLWFYLVSYCAFFLPINTQNSPYLILDSLFNVIMQVDTAIIQALGCNFCVCLEEKGKKLVPIS